MSFGIALPRALCGVRLLNGSILSSLSQRPSLFSPLFQPSRISLPRSNFSTSSSILFPPKPTSAYQPKRAPPPPPPPTKPPQGSPSPGPFPSAVKPKRTLPAKQAYHLLESFHYIPPPPYSPSDHDSLRLLAKNTISPSQRLELDSLDNELLAHKLAVEEKQISQTLGFVPLDGTYQIGEDLLAGLEKKDLSDPSWVWGEFCVPVPVRVEGRNGFNLNGVTDNTKWFVLPYVIFFTVGTLFAYAAAAQLTEFSTSVTSPSYTGFFVVTSALSFLAFVPWFASGSLPRLIHHVPNIVDLAPFTTWTSLRGVDSRALFNKVVGILISPVDFMVIRTTESRLALGGLAEDMRWKPFRAGCGRMWLGMLSHRDTTQFYRSIFMLWISGYLAYAFFNSDDNAGKEGAFSYIRRLIGAFLPDYASTEEKKETNVASPELKSTGVYEYLVFIITAGTLAAFVAQLHHSFVLLPKAANKLHPFLSKPSSIRTANPPWLMLPAPEIKQQKIILGDRLVHMLGVDRAALGLMEPGLALSTLALLSSCSNGGLWIFDTVPAIIPALLFPARYIIQDLSTIKRDWNTPRRHFGVGIVFGIVYFFFGSTFFAWSVSGFGELVIPPFDPNAPSEEPEKEPEVEVDPTWETYVFNGKEIKMPPRRST